MSRFGNDITVIDIDNAAAAQKYALGADTNGALRGDATDFFAWSAKRLTWISMKTNQIVSTDRPCRGRSKRVHSTQGGNSWLE